MKTLIFFLFWIQFISSFIFWMLVYSFWNIIWLFWEFEFSKVSFLEVLSNEWDYECGQKNTRVIITPRVAFFKFLR